MTGTAPDTTRALPDDADAPRALPLAAWAERDGLAAERDALSIERAALAEERDRAAAERDALAARNERLNHLLPRLRRLQFGAKSERLPEGQLQLGPEDTEAAIARGEVEAERRDPSLRRPRAAEGRAGRGALPAHLPRVEVTLSREDTTCPCCRGGMAVIGHDTWNGWT